MNTRDYDVLKFFYLHKPLSQRELTKLTGLSLGKVNKSVNLLKEEGYLDNNSDITEKTIRLIKDNKPKSAIILSAGYGLRLVPLCRDIPKALLEINGEILIERLINQLHEVGIFEIYVVVGYMKEKFDYLIDKYNVKLIVNEKYSAKNNLYSLSLVSNRIENSYILPSDIWFANNPFSETELYSWYMVSEEATSDSQLKMNRNKELVGTKESEPGNKEIGIAYICRSDCKTLISNISELRLNSSYDSAFWEKAAFINKSFMLKANLVNKDAYFEINTYDDLIKADVNSKSLNSNYIDIICESLNTSKENISSIVSLKFGMTNRSFMFNCNDKRYIFRIPGEGTDKLINRKQEYDVYTQIRDKNLCDNIAYINSENGYKITEFIENSRNCDPNNVDDVNKCMSVLKNFHNMKLKVNHYFDIFEQINYYEELRNKSSVYEDYNITKDNVFKLKEYIDKQDKDFCLTHIDAVPDNFIISDLGIRLIDWEYAAMQDPHVDIAMFAIYSLYDKPQIDSLITTYFKNNCPNHTRLKIYCYIASCGLLWSNWCEYKSTFGVEFGEYSLRQYRYAKDFYRYFMEEINNE